MHLYNVKGIHVLMNGRAQSKNNHSGKSRMKREDGTKHEFFLFQKLISQFGIWNLCAGAFHNEVE